MRRGKTHSCLAEILEESWKRILNTSPVFEKLQCEGVKSLCAHIEGNGHEEYPFQKDGDNRDLGKLITVTATIGLSRQGTTTCMRSAVANNFYGVDFNVNKTTNDIHHNDYLTTGSAPYEVQVRGTSLPTLSMAHIQHIIPTTGRENSARECISYTSCSSSLSPRRCPSSPWQSRFRVYTQAIRPTNWTSQPTTGRRECGCG